MFCWCALILVILLSLNGPVDARVRTTADAIIIEGNLFLLIRYGSLFYWKKQGFLCNYYKFHLENSQKNEKKKYFLRRQLRNSSFFYTYSQPHPWQSWLNSLYARQCTKEKNMPDILRFAIDFDGTSRINYTVEVKFKFPWRIYIFFSTAHKWSWVLVFFFYTRFIICINTCFCHQLPAGEGVES